jgi:hypothetical protein
MWVIAIYIGRIAQLVIAYIKRNLGFEFGIGLGAKHLNWASQ